jgi:hypothetical protein
MPTISVAKISRKFNLGNYESMEVGLEAFVVEGENVYEVLAGLEGTIGTYMQTHHAEALKTSNVPKPQVQTPSPQAQPQPQVQTPQPTKMVQLTIEEKLEKVKQHFGEFKDLLAFSTSNGKVVIRARQFLGSEVFSRVANIVRGLGGMYISAGKDSHFQVPLQNSEG